MYRGTKEYINKRNLKYKQIVAFPVCVFHTFPIENSIIKMN